MNNLAQNVKSIVTRIITGIVGGIFHPNVLLVLSFAAAVYAAYRTWGVTGGLWTFAVIAFLLAMANASQQS